MNNKLLGGVLLIIGTSIGGGMLALPIATAQLGFINALIFLVICWAVMTASALLLLEVNLWHPVNSNLITMAKTTLGRFGQVIAWVSYLLLLYALLAAYVSGGGDFLQHFLNGFHIKLSSKIATGLFAFLLSIVVYKGIRSVDYVNRGLMFSKLAATGLLVLCIFPFVSVDYLLTPGKLHHLPGVIASITVIITSFGFAVIVPSLRSYFKNNASQLRKAILIGSFIPLVCYILWELVIMGVVPSQGPISLTVMAHSSHSSSDLINALSQLLHKPLINFLAKTFTAICLATSFLGVALSLFDFLSDGFAIKKTNLNKLIIYALTFTPPLIIAYHYPNAFIKALSYAGVLCAILLIALPAMMAWSGRYIKKCASGYQVSGGKYLLTILLMTSFFLIALSLI
ncbi:putative tyrosine-specific transport protein [Candidatus Rickettsiella viridis]|uniref:Putative tyrosine-specific transport protein n=1 Tax=Candidatus Rickettsiella viridis TaxID=676208 RepID=A0A2Z5UW53_9COXI|nr:aromatic amino acid transport family protein [Candidatus Rickettsiella viridis]BBB15799.1 putative tyrosine-specific transport protein [Candidatus Rickettsiella viridis]